MNDLIKNFNINEVQKAGAIFDITKLDWLNSQHLSNLTIDEFKKELTPFLKNISIDINDHFNVDLLLESMRTSSNTLKGVADDLQPYYLDVVEYDQKAIDKFVDIEGQKILKDLNEILSTIDNWNENAIDLVLKNYQNTNNYSVPKVNQPIRVALTGSTKSPSLGLTLSLFEKENALKRIQTLMMLQN